MEGSEGDPTKEEVTLEQESDNIEKHFSEGDIVKNDIEIKEPEEPHAASISADELQIHLPVPPLSPPPPPLSPSQTATPLPPSQPDPSQPDILSCDGEKLYINDDDQKEDNTSEEPKVQESVEINKSQEQEDITTGMEDLDNDIQDTLYTMDDLTMSDSHNEEIRDGVDPDGEQKLIRARLVNTTELGCCEYCGGPVKKRRICSPLKKFCSKACARNCRKTKKEDENTAETLQEDIVAGVSSTAGSDSDHKMTWDDYLQAASNKAAPDSCFKHITTDVPGLKPGMKLEAVDRNNPPSYCVATVIKCVGHRVCIRYDGYGSDNSNDIWCNYQAEELHPIGWCAQNGYPLQPPKGVGSSLEAWRTFLTQTLTGALAAPQDLFKKSQEHFQPRVHGFEVGMKLEAIHPLRPSIICPATVTKSLGPYYFAVTPDFQHDLSPTTFCCHSDSPGIFPIGWCYRNGIELTYPANYSKKTFSWPKYLSICRATSAPSQLFKKVKAHKFRVGMKVEAVDLEQPAVICVATITNVIGRLLFLFFDGQSRFQFVDVEAPDIYPIGWCKRTGHPLVTPFGVMPSNYDSKTKVAETEILYLPSFDEVMGRQAASLPTASVAILPRKSSSRSEQEKDKEKDKDKDDNKGGMESEDKSGDSDISEDDCLASERFYHNKNQIFFNKGCCIGPLLNPERVKLLPDATPPGKVSTVIRTGLEMVATAALDPEKVIDLMQEGCGVRVTIKHEGKLLKKAISRVDSRPKLERYLKRFCRRLICCEYFLSLKPVGQPCPDQCKADDQGNLQGPKGLKAKRSREYFEVKHLGFEKKKRGRRRRKSEILGVASSQQGAMKNAISENGTAVPVTSVLPSSIRNRQLAPAYHIQPNGTRPAVATAALPGVQAPVVRFQGPGNVAVVRPNTNLQLPVRPHGTAIAPAQSPHIVIGAIHGTTPVAKQDGVLANGRTIIMTDATGPLGPTKTRIVTNVSGQRFATSSSGGGTTITFGRAPPNVTVCSSQTPPPLTRISDTVESISVSTDLGTVINAQPSPNSKSAIPGFSMTASSHANHSRGPPNVVVSLTQAMAAPGGTVQVSETVPGQYSSGSNPVRGVIRAPIVIPPQVKQETPPPPPLVHASKVSSGVRVIGPGTVVSSTKVSLVPSSFSQVRSLSQRGFTSAQLGQPRLYKHTSHAVSPGQTAHTVYIRPGKADTAISAGQHKRIMPANYQSFSQRISPKPPVIMHGLESIGTSKSTSRHQTSVFQSIGPTTRPIIAAKQGVIHTIHHNPSPSQGQIHPHSRAVSAPMKPSTVQSVTLEKVRAGIKSKADFLEYPPNNEKQMIHEQDIGKHYGKEGSLEKKDHVDEHGDEVAEPPKKRNLWWLTKKRKRKRSRLTYMKTKYRKKEDGNEVCDEVGLSDGVEIKKEDPTRMEYLDYPDRPKRGRLSDLNDLVMRLEDDGEGVLAMADEQDPDWDESIERKKTKQNIKPKRKGFGRPRKEGGSELSSPTLSNPPSPNLSSPSTIPNNPYVRRTSTKQLGTVPSDSKSHVLTLDPPPSRRPLSIGVDHEDSTSYKGKSARSASYSTADGYPSGGPIRSTSSHPSPVSPKSSASFKRRRLVDVGVNTSLPGCLNGRSPDLPSNPVTWSVDEVIQYVRSTDCCHYAVVFKEEEIDGQALLMLSRDALMQFTPMKLGPTLKMCSYISQLRLRAK